MLHSLLTEIVRRRLWPIPLIALAVALAAPLLFLKSSPVGTPAASAPAPAAASEGKLPVRAERLLASSDAGGAGNRRATRPSHDPFAPPKSRGSAVPAADAAPAASEAAGKQGSPSAAPSVAAGKPVPVIITNADGSTPEPDPTQAPPIGQDDPAPSGLTAVSAGVDVRFGEKVDSRLRREIPRLQTFVAGGAIVAVFVKYSPNRKKAVFAISPSTHVTGDVDCRRKEGLCRYVDIPAGQHARLTWRSADGTLMSRRLDVVSIDRASSGSSARAAQATGASPRVGRCLLEKVLRLAPDAQVAFNDCDE